MKSGASAEGDGEDDIKGSSLSLLCTETILSGSALSLFFLNGLI